MRSQHYIKIHGARVIVNDIHDIKRISLASCNGLPDVPSYPASSIIPDASIWHNNREYLCKHDTQ